MNNIYNVCKYLMAENAGVADILDTLRIKSPTFYKYLNLYKRAGFDIVKRSGGYKIVRYDNSVKLSDAEIGLIAYLKLLSFMLFPGVKNKNFSDMIDEMLKLTNAETEKEMLNKFELMKKAVKTNMYREKIELFEKYLNSNSEVILTLKNGEYMTLYPKETVFKNKKIFFSFIDKKNMENKLIDISKIVKLTPKIQKYYLNSETKEIVFELYGRLAKTYLLKEGERIIDSSSDKLVIGNNTSDKNTLFKRLLRYDTLCKVKFPKEDFTAFKILIEKSLENLDVVMDNNI